jgi:transcriptional regulator with XRE-family HTH domain
MSNAQFFGIVEFIGMTQPTNEELLFNEALCARTRALRDEKHWTAEQMASALGIPPDRYRKYEKRSPIPHYLIPRLALICDRTVEFILTGRTTKQLEAPVKASRMRA